MTRKTRVLVVDDEKAVLRFVDIGLTAAGYAVAATTNGQEAINIVKTENPDIVLLDILMVPMTGFEILAEIRTFTRIPVIVFTAKSFIADEAINAGATGYIAKPFKPEKLIEKIEEIMAGHDKDKNKEGKL